MLFRSCCFITLWLLGSKSIAAHCGYSSRMASITEAANLAALPRAFSRPEVVSDSSSLRVFEKSKMSRYAARSTRPQARTGRLASAFAVAIRYELLVMTALQIGRAHVCTPALNANLVSRIMIEITQKSKH